MRKTQLLFTLISLFSVSLLASCNTETSEPCPTCIECEECPTCPQEESEDTTLEQKTYSITFISDGYVFNSDLPESADPFESIQFSLTVTSGYSISEVNIYKENDETTLVSYSGDSILGYTFSMPEFNVVIEASCIGAYFNVSYDTNEDVYDNNDLSSSFTDYNNSTYKTGRVFYGLYYPNLSSGNLIGSAANNYIQIGSEILVAAQRQYTMDNVKLYANGEELENVSSNTEYGDNMFTFKYTVPDYDTKITASAENRYIAAKIDLSNVVDQEGNEIIEAFLYQSPTEQEQELSGLKIANDNEAPYIYAKVKDEYAEDYAIDEITLTWSEYTSAYSMNTQTSSKSTSWSSTSTSKDNNGTCAYVDKDDKCFRVPSKYYVDNQITITFTLKDISKFRGEAFVGNWRGFRFYNGSIYSTYKDITLSIDGAGFMTSSYTSTGTLNNKTIDSVYEDGVSGVISDGRIFYTDGNVAIHFYDTSASSYRTNSVFVYAKGDTLPTLDYVIVSGTNSYQYILRVLVDDVFVGAVYADSEASPMLYAGVNVTYNGDTLASSTSYSVTTSSGELLYSYEED